MDSFHFGGVLKVEKPKKNRGKNPFQLRKVANLFRVVELCVLLVLVSRFSAQLPVAVKSSSEYFRELKLMLSSPTFVFVLGNVIVVTLFAMSGHVSTGKVDFYEEFMQKSEKITSPSQNIRRPPMPDCEDKKVILEEKTAYRRSQSQKLIHGSKSKLDRALRRSETTESFAKLNVRPGEKLLIQGPFPEDSMSNDEFRRTIEAFIARQQRNLRQEEY